MTESIAERLKSVRDRMAVAAGRSGRNPDRITLVVVTKGVDPIRSRRAIEAGAAVLGENRVQEALEKIEVLSSFGRRAEAGAGKGDVRWHLIGHLQRNKVKQAVGCFELIHSVDDSELAREINQRAEQAGIIQKVLIQVNVAREVTKHGVPPEGLEALVHEAAGLPHLSLEGLMTIPPLTDDPEGSRTYFRWLAEKAEGLRQAGLPVRELSMGMSGDFEVAIEEGATLIRVGTAIFGPRGK